jgi:hypothetical protein
MRRPFLSAADVHGLELAALDTLQQGLAGYAVGQGGFEGGQPVLKWCVRPPGGARPGASAPTVKTPCGLAALWGDLSHGCHKDRSRGVLRLSPEAKETRWLGTLMWS